MNNAQKTHLYYKGFFLAIFVVTAVLMSGLTAVGKSPVALAAEQNGHEKKQVILLIVDRFNYHLLYHESGPVLRSILSRGTAGLMNGRAGSGNAESGYLSIGAGARAIAGAEGGQAYRKEENLDGISAAVAYLRNTGRFPEGEICHPQINVLYRKNRGLNYPVTIGRLGQQLADKGLTTAVFGNADLDFPNRSAVLIAMDQHGVVPRGQVDTEILKEDQLFPYGRRTDIEKLSQLVKGSLAEASLIVIEFGDFVRLDQYWDKLSPSRQKDLLAETMVELDQLLAKLEPFVVGGTALGLITPNSPLNLPEGGESLTPCLFLENPSARGLLYSARTRRPGLITNTDLAPMLISYLDGGGDLFAHEGGISVYSHSNPLAYLDQFYNRSRLVFQQRPPLLKVYILLLIGLLVISLGGVLLGIPAVGGLNQGFGFIMLVPLAALILGLWSNFPTATVYLSGLYLFGLTAILLLVLRPLQSKGGHIFWTVLGVMTAAALIVDTLNGSPLQQFSLLGYDPIAGARYYGLGNEYMGVLIGSTLLGSITMIGGIPSQILGNRTGSSLGKKKTAFAGGWFFIYLLIIYLLSAPGLGANLGGTLAAAVAFGAAWAGLGVHTGKGGKRDLLKGLVYFFFVALSLLWMLNFRGQGGLPSHVGQLGSTVAREGYSALWETAGRKLIMNWRLIRYSIWSRVLIALLGVTVVLCFYPLGMLKRLSKKEPEILQVTAAGGIGALAALLANDSGVVAAALVLLYTVLPLWISVVGEAFVETIQV